MMRKRSLLQRIDEILWPQKYQTQWTVFRGH
jgi:hypothetical protein